MKVRNHENFVLNGSAYNWSLKENLKKIHQFKLNDELYLTLSIALCVATRDGQITGCFFRGLQPELENTRNPPMS